MASVFVTGATGFMGCRLCGALVERGHAVRGLARAGSEGRLAAGVTAIVGNPLDAATYRDSLAGCDTMVHLVGVSHPSPAKAKQFREIDLASAREAVGAATAAAVSHFVYVSVAHPAPVMHEYIAARMAAEQAIGEAGLRATILRPWYVLGEGRRWPLLLRAGLPADGSVSGHAGRSAAAGSGHGGPDDRSHGGSDRAARVRRAGSGSAGNPREVKCRVTRRGASSSVMMRMPSG